MYLEDPWDKILAPFKLPEEQEPDPRMDPVSVFWEEAASTFAGKDVSPRERLHAQVCRFENGLHTQMAKDCPHFDTEDELGKITAKGWTSQ
jgi:hypothetical protein